MLDYAFEIEYLDKHLAAIISELERRDLLDNTLIIFTSDNGMPFPRSKANSYEISNHMPLTIMWKNGIINPGRVVEDYINFVDFTPTFLEDKAWNDNSNRKKLD
jgi:arylsulfatase A-like enzyme